MHQEHSTPVLRDLYDPCSEYMGYMGTNSNRKTKSFKEIANLQEQERDSKKPKLKPLTRLTEADSLAPEDSVPLTNESCSPRTTGTPSFVAAPYSTSGNFGYQPVINQSLGYLQRLRQSHPKVIEYQPMHTSADQEPDEDQVAAIFRGWASRKNSANNHKEDSQEVELERSNPNRNFGFQNDDPPQELDMQRVSSIAEEGDHAFRCSTTDQLQDRPITDDIGPVTFQKQSPSSTGFLFPTESSPTSPLLDTVEAMTARTGGRVYPVEPDTLKVGTSCLQGQTRENSSPGDQIEPKPAKRDGPDKNLRIPVYLTRNTQKMTVKPQANQETILKLCIQNEQLFKQNERLKGQLLNYELAMEENAVLKRKVTLLTKSLGLFKRTEVHASRTNHHQLSSNQSLKYVPGSIKDSRRVPERGSGVTTMLRSQSARSSQLLPPDSTYAGDFLMRAEWEQILASQNKPDHTQSKWAHCTSSQVASPRNTSCDRTNPNDEFGARQHLVPQLITSSVWIPGGHQSYLKPSYQTASKLDSRLRRHQIQLNSLLNLKATSSPTLTTRSNGTKISAWLTSTACPRSKQVESESKVRSQASMQRVSGAVQCRDTLKEHQNRSSMTQPQNTHFEARVLSSLRYTKPPLLQPGEQSQLISSFNELKKAPKNTPEKQPTRLGTPKILNSYAWYQKQHPPHQFETVRTPSKPILGHTASVSTAGTKSALQQLIQLREARKPNQSDNQRHLHSLQHSSLTLGPQVPAPLARRQQIIGVHK